MGDVFTLHNLFTLVMLIFLQAVLGFDNLLYISIESKRAPEHRQSFVRRAGVGLAIVLRIALLFAVVHAISAFQDPFARPRLGRIFEGEFNVHSLIVLGGGAFIVYTAIKEIMHMLSSEEPGEHVSDTRRSVAGSVAMITVMNVVFSFDSILSAIALTDEFWVMAVAVVLSGMLMIVLADRVAEFLKRNRMYEVLGLFILFLVGVMLLTEGGHLAHIHLWGHPVEAMSKSTFYFVIIVLVIVDVAQSRYQRKLDAVRSTQGQSPS